MRTRRVWWSREKGITSCVTLRDRRFAFVWSCCRATRLPYLSHIPTICTQPDNATIQNARPPRQSLSSNSTRAATWTSEGSQNTKNARRVSRPIKENSSAYKDGANYNSSSRQVGQVPMTHSESCRINPPFCIALMRSLNEVGTTLAPPQDGIARSFLHQGTNAEITFHPRSPKLSLQRL